MIAHLVLFTPHPTLGVDDREAMAAALEQAFTGIPGIARVKVGRRRLLGHSYDQLSPVHFEFLAVLEFESVDDLEAYLVHPAHVELGKRFRSSAQIALANDFEIVDAPALRTLVDPDSLA